MAGVGSRGKPRAQVLDRQVPRTAYRIVAAIALRLLAREFEQRNRIGKIGANRVVAACALIAKVSLIAHEQLLVTGGNEELSPVFRRARLTRGTHPSSVSRGFPRTRARLDTQTSSPAVIADASSCWVA